MKPKI